MTQPSPTHCTQCSDIATVKFSWPTTSGPQSAPLCQACAAAWWKQYQHTAAGQGLSITRLGGDS